MLCRGRLSFGTKSERRCQDSGLVPHLNFDSDGVDESEVDSSFCDVSMDSTVSEPSWDPDLASPAQHLSSSPVSEQNECSRRLSPVCLNFDESDEDATSVPLIRPRFAGYTSPCPSLTPPHKKLRSLKLFDTPHTPKSLLQKSQRRISRLRGRPSLNSSNTEKNDSLIGTPRVLLDPAGPQTNINPFTPVVCSGRTLTRLSSSLKRSRNSR